jgi:hypothetical protein
MRHQAMLRADLARLPLKDATTLPDSSGGQDLISPLDADSTIVGVRSISRSVSTSRTPSRIGLLHLVLAFLLFATLSSAWLATLHLIRSQGLILIGDEPHYLIEALSISRFHTLNMNPAYNFAVLHHIVYPWVAHPGPHLAAAIGQSIHRHGLYLPFHGIGLSVLLALPMLAGTSTASVTLILVLAGLTVGLVYLTSEASEIRSPCCWAIGGLFFAPAVCLAATQVVPDFINGLVMGIIVMSIAVIEFRGSCRWSQIGVVSASLVVLPWLDQKNILYPLPLLVAFLLCCLRAKVPPKALRWVIVPAVVSLAGLLVLNLYEFGDLLGGPQVLELATRNTAVRALALLVDRRQGLFVQAPVALLGIAGLWTSRKRLPIAALAGAFVVLSTLYGNATQPASFGGYGFIGRFQWPTLPVLLAFAGLLLLNMWKVRRLLVAGISVLIGILYLVQLVPILRNEHVYYNGSGWDPQSYVGWWGGLDPSPILGYIGRNVFSNTRVDLGAVCVCLAGSIVVYLLVQLSSRPARPHLWLIGAALIALSAIFPATLSSEALLPMFVKPGVVTALSPVRVCDTRGGNPSNLTGTALQCSHGTFGSPVVAGRVLSFRVTGAFGVPHAGVTAVILNITSTDSVSAGTMTAFPSNRGLPFTPSLFYQPGRNSSSIAQVATGPGGSVSLSATSQTDVLVDLEGYVSAASSDTAGQYHPFATGTTRCEESSVSSEPVSSRCGSSPGKEIQLAPGTPGTTPLAPPEGVATPGATAALLSLAVEHPAATGYVSAYPTGREPGVVSEVSLTTGQPASNQILVPTDSSGAVTFYASEPTTIVVHVLGYFSGLGVTRGTDYTPEIAPVRICDTRGTNPSALRAPYTQCNPGTQNGPNTPLGPGSTRTIKVAGLGYVPIGARAVALTVTALPAAAPGYLSIDPESTASPRRDIAYTAELPTIGGLVANLSPDGTLRVENVGHGPANLVIDLVGWYSD